MADIVYETDNSSTAPPAFVGVPYVWMPPYHGAATALTACSISAGALPAGLAMKNSTTQPTITGTPTTANVPGLYTFTVSITDTAGAVTHQFTMELYDASQYPNRDTEAGGGEPNAADLETEWPTVQ